MKQFGTDSNFFLLFLLTAIPLMPVPLTKQTVGNSSNGMVIVSAHIKYLNNNEQNLAIYFLQAFKLSAGYINANLPATRAHKNPNYVE